MECMCCVVPGISYKIEKIFWTTDEYGSHSHKEKNSCEVLDAAQVPTYCTLYFNDTLIYDEFVLISRMLHMNNVEEKIQKVEPRYDPWCKIRPFLDHFNEVSKPKHLYIPSGCGTKLCLTSFYQIKDTLGLV